LTLALAHVAGAAAADMGRRAGHLGHHGAIAWNAETRAVGYAWDHRTRRSAEIAALGQCGHGACEVVLRVRNACGVFMHGGAGRTFTARGATYDEARLHARRQCGTAACEEIAWVCTK
jgi:serine/threonine-protein kinase